jgi:hypothetical protein
LLFYRITLGEPRIRAVCNYRTSGGLVVVSIAGEEITPKCAADALRAMAEGIEKNGIPKTLTEMRCHLLN